MDKINFYELIHSFSSENRKILQNSESNVCLCCKQAVAYSEIISWITENSGEETAVCPHCMVDCIVPYEVDGIYELDDKLIDELYEYWF
ncbi:MAG: hypothetical protein IJD78_06075 [Clostridia bacterium]|nr:hypothetical protein [Clostridia bacterium]